MLTINFFLILSAAVVVHIIIASKIKRNLSYAGYHKPYHYALFVASSLLAIAFGALLMIKQINQIELGTQLTFGRRLLIIAPLFIGAILPFVILWSKKTRYQLQLKKEVTFVINFIIIYLEAGFTVDQAIERLIVILQHYRYAFAKELLITWHDLRFLGDRKQAWQRMIDRLGERDWVLFVRLLQREDLFDKYLIDSLAKHSQVLHQYRLESVETHIEKMGNYTLFVAVLLIMPALFIVVATPLALFLIKFLFGVSL